MKTISWRTAALLAIALAAALPARAQVTTNSQFVLVATEQGTLEAYFTNDGTIFSAPVQVTNEPGTRLAEMAVADFNGDGQLDFVTFDNSTRSVHVYLREGATTFAPFFLAGLDPDPKQDFYDGLGQEALAPDYGLGVIPADLDNDGDMDFLEAKNADFLLDRYWIAKGNAWINNGTGVFSKVANAFDFSSIWTGWTLGMSSTLGDINGDGFPDMLVSEQAAGGDGPSRVYALLGNGDGTFGAPVHKFTTTHPATFISLGDVNNSGTVDALVGMDDDGDPGQVYVFFGMGGPDGNFFPTQYEAFDTNPAESGTDAPGGGKFQLVDLSGDGVLDVVASPGLTGPVPGTPTPGQLVYYRGLGDGRFAFPTVIAPEIFMNTGFAAPVHDRPIFAHQPGDFDGTGGIDFRDLAYLLNQRSHPAMGPEDPFDLNRDLVVNVGDTRKLITMCTLPRCAFVAGD